MTIYNPQEQKFGEVLAPATPAEGLNLLAGLTAVQSQIIGLVDVIRDVAAGNMQATAAGASTVGDRQCDRFTVVQSDDMSSDKWDVWLEQQDVPLPCKFVVNSSGGLTRDVQTNGFSWKLNPALSSEAFKFVPPDGSKMVQEVSALGLQPPE